MKKGWDYKGAGVHIEAQDDFIANLKEQVSITFDPYVIGGLGGFAGLYELKGFHNPILVASTDGVGTKLLIAQESKNHSTIGQDLVAMCVNDILVQGAKPLFFLDYLATGKLLQEEAQEILKGIILACREVPCALLGGETAEMPGFYPPGRYDLAGFALGVVEKDNLITGDRIGGGDLLIGLSSSGLHSNGFSLVRKVLFEEGEFSLDSTHPGLDSSLGEELLLPTRIYGRMVLPLVDKGFVKGMAHVTGGGILGNIKRILPQDCTATIDTTTWSYPFIFQLLQQLGGISIQDMYTTFNMGIGFVLVVAKEYGSGVIEHFSSLGEEALIIGEITKGKKGVVLL